MIGDQQLGLVGMSVRAGRAVVGTAGVRAALQRGELALVVLASDRSEKTDQKVGRLARGKGIPTASGPKAVELGGCGSRHSEVQ
ncbi:MAG: L7Ae/L30e/S12e/Gadd45 family ribosomal protein [Gemmatimonadales bacterium]